MGQCASEKSICGVGVKSNYSIYCIFFSKTALFLTETRLFCYL